MLPIQVRIRYGPIKIIQICELCQVYPLGNKYSRLVLYVITVPVFPFLSYIFGGRLEIGWETGFLHNSSEKITGLPPPSQPVAG